jgi:acetyl-CoA carboxylase biotin carboxyl carrier protein
MNPEELNELKELIEFLKENKIGEFDLERGDLKVRIKFAQEGGADMAGLTRLLAAQNAAQATANLAPIPSAARPAENVTAAAQASTEGAAASDEDASLHLVKSPIVGTFYDAASPGAAPFVKIGDEVEVGQVLCIVEAMKLMNEIECDAAGEIVKRFVQSGQPVEYGQPLFAVRPGK